MARYRRYRKYSRRSTGKWAPNITKIRDSISCSTGEWSDNTVLTSNPVQLQTTVSQTYTVKNFEITFTIEAGSANSVNTLEGITAYVMFVPQGMNVTNDYYLQHPEYILNYKYLGSPSTRQGSETTYVETQQFQPFRLRTRLSRKLQTGDSIILYFNGVNTSTDNQTLYVDGLVRWWTKAN